MAALKIVFFFLIAVGAAYASNRDTTFSVVAYNVENFFDLDGVSIFDDYEQDYPDDHLGYAPRKLLTKLSAAVRVLKTVGDGTGPEIILFQEFENDFSPQSSVTDFDAFLEAHAGKSVSTMLGEGWQSEYEGIPAVAWMLKAMADAGMTGYQVAVAPQKPRSKGIAHVNATFSKFPILESNAYPLKEARDVLEVSIDVDGHVVWLFNNHWKSGASNPEREPIRVANARVLRRLVDARLAENPNADIIAGGDLNAHYNQSALFPRIQTGINDILGSSGDERFTENDLYNLWFELPVEDRYSEVWRGRKGTLMHLIVSPGLYDDKGVSYLDSSFDKIVIPELNSDPFGRPLKWHFAGSEGGGASDHFPLVAEFSVKPFLPRSQPSKGDDAPRKEILLRMPSEVIRSLPDGRFLSGLSDDELAPYVNKLHMVRAKVISTRPLKLRVGGEDWAAFAPDREVFDELRDEARKRSTRLVVQPNYWRGRKQLIVERVL